MSDVSDEVLSSDGSEEEVKSKSKKLASKKRPEPSDSDSGDDSPPPKKSSKKIEKSVPKKKSSSGKKEEEKNSWALSSTRSVAINEFKGRQIIDIREYYIDGSGDKKPGRKGIGLSIPQWEKLVSQIKEIDAAVKKAAA